MLYKKSFIALSLFLAACNGSNDQKTSNYDDKGTPAKGDIFVTTSLGEASNLVWFLSSDSPSHSLAGLMYEGLLTYDGNANIVPNYAESWEISEDNLTITFKLRKDLKWQDGEKLTANDVMATFNAVTSDTTRTPYAGDYKMVQEARVVDDYTFEVTYAEPFAPALASWVSFAVLPKHVLAKDEDTNNTSLKTTPVASGMYTLDKWDRSKEAVLNANPSYFRHEPWISKRRVRVIPDMDTQFLELKAGRIDTMGLKPVQFTRLTNKDEFTNKYSKFKYLSNSYTFMGFNLKRPLFTDKLVRQALSFATPRQQLVDVVLMGQGLPLAAPYKPGTWVYNDKLQPYPYSLDTSKDLLQQAGWADSNGDGILDKDINGKNTPFSFTVVTNQGNDQRIKTAEVLQQSFKQIGVEMKIQVQEWSTFIEQTIDGKNFDAMILGWSLPPEPDPYDIWHSSKQGPKEFNVIGFENAAADDAIINSRATFDQAERKIHLDKFQEILHEQQPYLFLYAPYSLLSVHKRVKGIEPMPMGVTYNNYDWYVPAEQQLYKNHTMKP